MKQLKSILVLLFALLLMVGCSSAAQTKTVAINEENFPDAALRTIAISYDINDDDLLDESEILAVEELEFGYNEVLDFKGLEHFSGLKALKISSSTMTEFDPSIFPELESLMITFAGIQEIDLSKNTKLKSLDMSFTNLQSIDLSALTELESITLDLAQISEVDFSNNAKLESISLAFSSAIETIDVSHNPELKSLDIMALTSLDTLDISNNPKLEYLAIAFTAINTLDASNMSKESEVNTILMQGSRLVSMIDAPNSVWTNETIGSSALRAHKEFASVTLFEDYNINPDLIFDLEGASIDLEEGYLLVNPDNKTGYVTYKYYVNEAKDKYIECKIQMDATLTQ